MTDRQDLLREGIKRPLPLAYHPLYRFYEGGSLTRNFRGLPEREDDWWSEDWVGSCTCANNPDPDGHTQGLSTVDISGIGAVPLKDVVEAFPDEMVGARFAARWGSITGVLVKLLSPRGPSPCTPIRPENGLKGVSVPSLGKRKPGSSWKHRVTGQNRPMPDLGSPPGWNGRGSPKP